MCRVWRLQQVRSWPHHSDQPLGSARHDGSSFRRKKVIIPLDCAIRWLYWLRSARPKRNAPNCQRCYVDHGLKSPRERRKVIVWKEHERQINYIQPHPKRITDDKAKKIRTEQDSVSHKQPQKQKQQRTFNTANVAANLGNCASDIAELPMQKVRGCIGNRQR